MRDHLSVREALELLVDPFDAEPDRWEALIAAAAPARLPRARRFSLRLQLSAAAAAVAATVAIVVASPWQTGPTSIGAAQAAEILQRAQSALAFRPGLVAHARIRITYVLVPVRKDDRTVRERVDTESWARTARPFDNHTVLACGSVRLEHGTTSEPCRSLYFDATTGVLYRDARFTASDCAAAGYQDPAARLRSELAAGRLVVAGHATVRGRSAYRLEPSPTAKQLGAFGTYCVDAATYRPLREQWGEPGALASARYRTIRETYDFLVFEYLPPTAANRAATDIRRQHPDAPIAPLDAMPAGPVRDLVFSVDSGGVPYARSLKRADPRPSRGVTCPAALRAADSWRARLSAVRCLAPGA